ncbi:unnamed protein product [Chondrus crispus]|uniref:Uncharacterized protein n=1 Tax=Chondrus crispus TaxID=2769 RepID=R7Q6X9_CHOCR|nr:unnamed protein product [Chondrus crispus]XP_005713028.1 unnamed protein product [Chondrus crispus]CDF33223.1 unnamed protein product [Chondrus crispus]CDF33225.1 unnamed protein product [Chondrus crispus]|eukprot:XP_005713026.1 unnamed protein product [Chondrus crispus]
MSNNVNAGEDIFRDIEEVWRGARNTKQYFLAIVNINAAHGVWLRIRFTSNIKYVCFNTDKRRVKRQGSGERGLPGSGKMGALAEQFPNSKMSV